MYQLKRKLKSVAPYIQNNPEAIIEGVRDKTATTQIGKKVHEPEKTGYKNDKGYFIPSKQIKGAMNGAGKKVKLGKASMFNFMKACVFFEGIENQMKRNGKPIQKYDFIYNEPILKPPPKSDMVFNPRVAFNDWETEISINVLEDSIPEEKIDEVLRYAGLYVGIGARHPEYGRFVVVG